MLKPSTRRTYPESRSKRNFDSRKKRAIAKAKIQKFTDKTKALSRRKPQGRRGGQKTAWVCIYLFHCFLLGCPLAFSAGTSFESVWVGVLVGVIFIVLFGGLFIVFYAIEGYGLKTGTLTSKKECGLGCGGYFLGGAIYLGIMAVVYLSEFDILLAKVFGIVSFVMLFLGIGIIFFIWKRIKKESGKDE